MTDLFKEIWQTMTTSKLRTLLTGLSVSWGIFMLILLLSIAQGVINGFTEMAGTEDHYLLDMWGGRTTKAHQGMKEGRRIELKSTDFDAIAKADPALVTGVDGDYYFNATISTTKDYLTASQCVGTYPSEARRGYKIRQGRFLNEADMRGARKVMVIDTVAASKLFRNPDEAVGQIVNVGGLSFTVVGVYSHEWRDDVIIPYTTARALNGYSDNVDNVRVHFSDMVEGTDESAKLVQEVREALSMRHKFAPDDESAVRIRDRYSQYEQALTGLGILNTAMWVIGLLTLITGIVGVSNIMFVSVRERTHEIGIRRAIGAKPRGILTQIVTESVAMTTFFGYIGIVMGTLATEVVKRAFAGSEFMVNPSVDLHVAFEVTVALIIAGALAGIFPALRAIKVKPVEALRDE